MNSWKFINDKRVEACRTEWGLITLRVYHYVTDYNRGRSSTGFGPELIILKISCACQCMHACWSYLHKKSHLTALMIHISFKSQIYVQIAIVKHCILYPCCQVHNGSWHRWSLPFGGPCSVWEWNSRFISWDNCRPQLLTLEQRPLHPRHQFYTFTMWRHRSCDTGRNELISWCIMLVLAV